jgi:hypothetical protein
MKFFSSKTLPVFFMLFGPVAWAPPASAGFATYTDRASFVMASTALTLIDFEGIAPIDGFVPYGTGGSLTLGGVTFTAESQTELFVDSASYYAATYGPPGYNLGAGDYLLAGNFDPTSLTVALPSGITAVGFDLGTFDDSTSAVAITLSTGEMFQISAPFPATTFVGITTSIPIALISLEIAQGDRRDTLNLDTFTFGAAAVPEPSSLALLGGGAPAIAWRLARRKAGQGKHSVA